ncbi:MAG: PAS domain-containing protein, partial [Chloroflexi bacterium]|nr:PAS domain-containing protein [Chloroflexota bacterium]
YRSEDNGYLLLLGISSLFVGSIDLIHVLAYKGMGIFPGYDANLPTQLWIAARYLQSLSLLGASALIYAAPRTRLQRRYAPHAVFVGYMLLTALVLIACFRRFFPDWYIEGVGLTPFKRISEYVILAVLVASMLLLWGKRALFTQEVLHWLMAFFIATIFAELAFAFYISVYSLSNMIGHLFKAVAFYGLYRAIVFTGIVRPQTLLFRALQASEELYRLLVESAADTIHIKDRQMRYRLVNSQLARHLGLSKEQILGKTALELYPEPLARRIMADDERVLTTGEALEVEEELPWVEGPRIMLTRKVPLRNVEGEVVGIVTISRDITERKRAEEERERLRTQLAQAQKMQAVGQLAGGVAHDFNNMLTVINGYAQMVLGALTPADPLYAMLEEVLKAGQRSADLVRQLLAFARQQMIFPRVLDLNEAVEGMLKMLRRLIGENIDLRWSPAAELWPVEMDPSQIDQILANLCLNARDAIEGNGQVSIETGNVVLDAVACAGHAEAVPGEYVLLVVSDDGCGMDKETLARIFEPFFTTKEVGRGTGLGLATVYGIVKQSGGFIDVYSEPGRGTTFKIYLPRYVGLLEEKPAADADEGARGNGELVLMVEDDPAVLAVGKQMLESVGYAVLAAGSPGEALRLAAEHAGQIRLLISDVIMPEMNGRDLAERLRESHPEIRCLFMSGYTADVIAPQGIPDEGVHLIQKPFSMAGLAAKVQEVLRHAPDIENDI